MGVAGRDASLRWVAGIVAFACLMLCILSQAGTASAAEPVLLKSFGPDGTESSNFERASSVAIDLQNGTVYVLDAEVGAIYKFDSSGQPLVFGGTAAYLSGNRLEGVNPYNGQAKAQIAVDPTTHTLYVTEEHVLRAFREDGEAANFTEGPGAGSNEISGFNELWGVAVDISGDIYASDHETETVSILSPNGAPLTSTPAQDAANLAVTSSGMVYVMAGEAAVNRLTPSSFPVESTTTYSVGTPIEPQTAAFINGIGQEPATQSAYVLETNFLKGWIRVYDQSGAFVKSFGEPGTATESDALGDLAQGISVLGAGNEHEFYIGNTQSGAGGESKVGIYGPEPVIVAPPTIISVSAADVTGDSATLQASINPNTAETIYTFEYGVGNCATSVCTSIPVSGGSIKAGQLPVEVSEEIFGLTPGTTYHYRVVAENEHGSTVGDDHTFTTQPGGVGFELSDSRVWEMVSPPNKHGGVLLSSRLGVIQAAANGEGIIYSSAGSIESNPDGNRSSEASTIRARRATGSWQSKDITVPNTNVVPFAVGFKSEYKLFDPKLSVAIVEPRDGTHLSPLASERTPYLREEGEPAVFTPLVTGAEGSANVPPGTEFGGSLLKPTGLVHVVGANSGLSRLVLTSEVSLAPGVPGGALYQWSAGQLVPVSVLPAGEGGAVSPASGVGSGFGSVRNAVSDDGERVFWSPGGLVGQLSALYLRVVEAGETMRLDTVQPGATGAGQVNPVFQGADPEAKVAFFTDSQQLTQDASPHGRDLYRCEMPGDGNLAGGCADLSDITAPVPSGSESAEVVGISPGLSEDATRAYFVALGVLDSEPNSWGNEADAGEPNLYLWQQGEGIRYIATLSTDDEPAWGGQLGEGWQLNSAVSPSGRYMAFMSNRGLTGFDNHDADSGKAVQEAFEYDALKDELVCISCNPSGALPSGQLGTAERPLVDPQLLWSNKWLAAVLPEPTANATAGVSLYQPRVVFDTGRAFFNAFDSLVPADINRQWDIYQYEPIGTGSCNTTSGSTSIVRAEGGCVGLISSGTGEQEAGFLDASASGNDVFFLTPAKLSVRDKDDVRDVYDARVDGRLEMLSTVTGCSGQACRSPEGPPIDSLPASSTFAGAGNLKAAKKCAKGKRKLHRDGRARCVRTHKRHQHGKKGRR